MTLQSSFLYITREKDTRERDGRGDLFLFCRSPFVLCLFHFKLVLFVPTAAQQRQQTFSHTNNLCKSSAPVAGASKIAS